MKSIILTLALAAGLMAGLTACGGGSEPAFYMASGSGFVSLVQWQPPVNGESHGTVTDDEPTGTLPDQTLNVTNVPVNVTINGSQVTLTPTGLYALSGTVIDGSLGSDGLTITSAPGSNGTISAGTLPPSTAAAYNAAVAALRKNIGQANATALAQQQAQQAQAAQQQKIASDQQAASSAVSFLQTDVGALGSDTSGMGGDAQSAGADLASTRSDASQGPGSDCVNASSTVYNDAATTLYNDQVTTMANDKSTLQQDIGTVRADIGTLEADLATLSADGASAPPGSQPALQAANSAIGTAISKANGDISTVNSDVQQG